MTVDEVTRAAAGVEKVIEVMVFVPMPKKLEQKGVATLLALIVLIISSMTSQATSERLTSSG